MRRFFLLFSMSVAVAATCLSQTMQGVVLNENEKPLKAVNVVALGTSFGTVSDEAGAFSLNLKPGKYTLQFSYMGYETVEILTETRKHSQPLKIIMLPLTILTDEVVVSATRAGAKSPTAYVNISREELQQRNSLLDIPYMLELTPAFVATSEAGNGIGYTNFRVRGTDATRINVTVNGIPLNDAESQSIFWVNMPDFSSSVSSLQIQRGVGTSGNGPAAFGATMNFETHITERKPYAGVQLFAGSFNTCKKSFSAGTGIMDNGFSFDMRASKLNSDGYIEYSGSDHSSLFFTGAWRNASTLIRANVIHGREKTGISWWGVPSDSLETNRRYNPAGEYYDQAGVRRYYENQTDNYVQTHYHLLFTKELKHDFSLNAALHYTRGDGYYEQYEQDENLLGFGFDIDTSSDLIIRKMMANDFYGATYSLSYNNNRLQTILGGAVNRYDGQHFGNIIWMRTAFDSEANHEYYRNTGTKTDISHFIKCNYQLTEALNFYTDLQYRHILYNMAGVDDDLMPDGSQKILDQAHTFRFFNPKAGLFYEISSKMMAYVSFATGHREPTRANFEDAVGDENRIPQRERLYDYELGWSYRSGRLLASANLYYMDYIDQIVPTGEKSSVGYDIMTNVPESYRAGIELSAGVQLFAGLQLNGNISLSRNKIMNYVQWASHYDDEWNEEYLPVDLGNTDIAYSPAIVGAAVLQWNAFKNFDVSFSSKYVGSQYFDNTMNAQRKLDAYWVNNLQFDYRILSKLCKEFSVRLAVNNVFNAMYSSNAYGGLWFEQGVEQTWSYYYPQAGRHFLGGIVVKF